MKECMKVFVSDDGDDDDDDHTKYLHFVEFKNKYKIINIKCIIHNVNAETKKTN